MPPAAPRVPSSFGLQLPDVTSPFAPLLHEVYPATPSMFQTLVIPMVFEIVKVASVRIHLR
jgi:hypothetical protein